MNSPARSGLTQIELLVALSVIGILVALLIPAVQSAREASRRVQCQSRLHDLGRAFNSFESARLAFPSGQEPSVDKLGLGRLYSTSFFSPHVQLLPYLDQAALYSQLNTSFDLAFYFDPELSPSAAKKDVPVFRCPSDPEAVGTNYRACTGPAPYAIKSKLDPDGGLGAFACVARLRASDFRDGLSSTIAFSEKLKSAKPPHQFSANDFWFSGTFYLLGYQPPTDLMVSICNSLEGTPPHYQPNCGRSWAIAGYDFTWYNHSVTPNDEIYDCSVQSYSQTGGTPSGGGVYKASSNHTGGVNCAFGDAHVRFISDSIDLSVWRALSTRAGSDPIASLDN